MALVPSASPQSGPAVAVPPVAASPSATPPSTVMVSSPPAPAPVSPTPPAAVIPSASSPPRTSPPPPSLPSSPSPPSPTSNPPPSSASNPSPPSNSAVSPPPPPPSPAPPPPSTKTTPSTPSSTTTSTTSSPSSSSSFSTTAIIGIAVAAAVVLFLVFICACCFSKKKRRKHHFPPKHPPPHPHPHHPPPPPPRPLSNKAGGQQWDWPAFPPSAEAGSGGNMAPPPPPPPPPPFSIANAGYGQAKKPDSPSEQPSPSMGSSRCWFTYEELKAATDNFSAANLLGQGGFGCVYKGTLPSGQIIAVKQLKFSGGHGEREFQAEVETISRVHHRHLVSLAGYCRAESQRLLVYEYVPNWTLEYHLHGRGTPVLSWKARQKIAIGAARGLAYLHEDCHPRIIHRDIKSSNILIDDEFEAQVADFGLAKFTSDSNTHVTTRVMGTFGYMAPEYASSGKLTEKSDVFSFGVVLLELISGRKPVDPSLPGGDESLVEWARPLLSQVLEGGNAGLVVDSKLDDYDEKEMMKMIEAAAACVRYSAHKRPRMGQVVRALEDDVSISELNKGVRPGQSGLYPPSHRGSSDYESSHYSADMKRFRQLALGSQEYASEEKASSIDYQSSSREAERIATKPSQTPLKFTVRPIRGGSSSTFGSNQSSSSHEMNV